jgi:hypothetical protein
MAQFPHLANTSAGRGTMSAFIYIYKNEQKEGPFSLEQVKSDLIEGVLSNGDLSWRPGLADWVPLRVLLLAPEPAPCPQYKGNLRYVTESSQSGTGTIVFVLGILFAPLCVGIPILIWGWILMSERKNYWHCRGCGRTFPV